MAKPVNEPNILSATDSGRSAASPAACDPGTAAVLRPLLLGTSGVRLGALEPRCEQLLQLMPVAAFACDADGKLVFYNRRAGELWGWNAPDAGMSATVEWFVVDSGLAPTDTVSPLVVALRSGEPCHDLEMVLRRPDGSRLAAAVTIDPLRADAGRVVGAIVLVSERRSRDRHDALLARLSGQLATVAREAEIVRLTARMVGEHLGVQRCGFVENERGAQSLKVIPGWMRDPLPSLAGRHAVQALGDAEWQRTLGSARIAIADVTTHPQTRAVADNYRQRGVRAYAGAPFARDGHWVASLTVTSNEPRPWEEDEVALLEHVIARVWPLIERARAEAALELITTHAPVVLAYLDSESRVVFVNHAFAARWQMSPAELMGRSLAEIIGPTAFAVAEPYVARVLGGEAVQFEAEIPYERAGRRYVRISFAPDRDTEGNLRGYLWAVNDLTEHRVMEQAVRESEERFRLLAEHAPVGIFRTDAAGDCTFVNEQWCRMAGMAAQDALGRGWELALHPDDRKRVGEGWEQARHTGAPFACEHRFLRSDGAVLWLAASAVETRDAAGVSTGCIGTVVDITDRKLAEFALRESEKRFRLVASRAPVGIFMADAQGNTIFVNASWCSMAGLSPEEAQGQGWVQAVHPDDRAKVVGEWQEAVRGGVSSKAEFRFLRRDGTITWVHGTAVQLRDTNGRLTGYIGTVADFTERKAAEMALRESEERFRMLADNIMQFAWVCDPAGRVLWVNRRFMDYTGWSAERFSSGDAAQLYHPDHSAGIAEKFQQHLRSGEMWEDSFPLRRADGAYRWFLSRAIPIRDAAGKITRWFGTNTDITDVRETQEMLRKAQQELLAHAGDLERKVEARTASLRDAIVQMEEFSYSVSHDLRAPLRAMNAYADALIEDYGPKLDDTGRDYLRRIQRNSERMERLTHDMLSFSRIARAEIVLGPVDLAPVLRDVVGQYAELQAEAADLVVEAPLHRVRGHELSLGQCLGNLLTNAAKFVAPGVRPRIRVFTRDLGAVVRVGVADNGIGIRPEHQGNLFRMFERVPTSVPYEGTGIGLAIVRKAVEKMGGRYGVESDGVNGSCFWIELPKD
jgi:PAS domain S-box-containing protein